MAKTRRDKYDLLTLAIKQQLIGCDIIFEDEDGNEVVRTVKDFHISLNTNELHASFENGDGDVLNLKRRYVVEIDSTYKSVKAKKKKNRAKRSS